MESLLIGISGVVSYIDNILVTGCSGDEHLLHLEEILCRLTEARLRLKKEKCMFSSSSIQYLGSTIDANGLHPIEEVPSHTGVSELKSYLGLLSYYSKLLPNLSLYLHIYTYVLLRDKEP